MSRSKRYQAVAEKVDPSKTYTIDEAVALLKETVKTKFDPSVELHARLGIDVSKSDQQVRSTIDLPHGSGKQVRIAVFAEEEKQADAAAADVVGGEDLIEKIQKSGKIDFDVAVATPGMMKHMAKVAKVLGPKGLMPSPKNETVTPNVKEAIEALKKGKIAFKNDATGNVHVIVGKASFAEQQLKENLVEAIDAIRKAKPSSSKGTYLKTLSVNVTMGPGIRITTA